MSATGLLDIDLSFLPAEIGIAVTHRQGGVSQVPYDSNNLALHVGDQAELVEQNRQGLLAQLEGARGIQWLNQVHGIKLVESTKLLRESDQTPSADGCYSLEPGIACAVMTADCLPVLLWDKEAKQVLAAHAGWRGLAAGVLRQSLEVFDGKSVSAFLGPAISQAYFEVGIDVLEAFFESAIDNDHMETMASAFKPSINNPLKFYADLPLLARAELTALGVNEVYGGDFCSYKDDGNFYSYRRACHQNQPETGRMASLIWLKS